MNENCFENIFEIIFLSHIATTSSDTEPQLLIELTAFG
jgi:hypothetical protein